MIVIIQFPDWLKINRTHLRRISSLRRNHSQARGTISCHRMSMTQFDKHRPSWSFKQRQLNQAITITLRLTEHANIFLNTCPVVVISHLFLQHLLPCTRSQQCFITATVRSFGHFEHVELPLSLYCDVAFTCCE